MKSFVTLCLLFSLTLASSISPRTLTKKFIDEINSKQSTWVAGPNFLHENFTLSDLHLMGSGINGFHSDRNYQPKIVSYSDSIEALPVSFDARTAWPFCESIREIRHQGACGSCWAFGTVEMMTDRLCIHSNGEQKFTFSPEDLLACSPLGSCAGGLQMLPLEYWKEEGVVSGGDVGSNEGCLPYEEEAFKSGITPSCVKSCRNGYRTTFSTDKHFGAEVYRIEFFNVEAIQREILTNGPVDTAFMVFEDFYNYRSGVYQHTSGNFVGFHLVKVIGWGEENDVPYWLVANSWGTGWGADGGFFKMLRGQNHCLFETTVAAALPKL